MQLLDLFLKGKQTQEGQLSSDLSFIYAVTGDSGEVKQFEYIKFISCYNLYPDA